MSERRVSKLLVRGAVDVAVAAVALVIGIGVFALVNRGGGDAHAAPTANDPNAFTAPSSLPTLPPIGQQVQPSPTGGAPTAREAIEGYLQAEVAGDFASSYLFLSSADQTLYRNPAKWASVHVDRPTIVGYQLNTLDDQPDRAQATAAVAYSPHLDAVDGLVPAHVDATWVAVKEAGLWRVSLADSTAKPVWPSDTAAPTAVADWAKARQSCESGSAAGELGEGLFGYPTLADGLCHKTGAVQVSAPEPLDGVAGASVVAAFGADAQSWARVIDITGPVALRAVVAPLGDTWLVVAVLPAAAGSASPSAPPIAP